MEGRIKEMNNNSTIFRLKLKEVFINFNDWNEHISPTEAVDKIIKIFDDELNELVVEERINHRSICSRTIRKIKENILFAAENLDPNAELIAPEPKQ